jgi:DNA-binding LytR/AlgR family response regulator
MRDLRPAQHALHRTFPTAVLQYSIDQFETAPGSYLLLHYRQKSLRLTNKQKQLSLTIPRLINDWP